MKKQFRFNGKSVMIKAEHVEGIKYKFTYYVDNDNINEYEEEVNGLKKAMNSAMEHAKTLIS